DFHVTGVQTCALPIYIVFTLGSMIVTIIIPILTAVIEIFLLGHGEIFTTSSMMYLFRAYGLFMVQFMGYTAILVILAIVTQDNRSEEHTSELQSRENL